MPNVGVALCKVCGRTVIQDGDLEQERSVVQRLWQVARGCLNAQNAATRSAESVNWRGALTEAKGESSLV